jgi:hypothetical protein
MFARIHAAWRARRERRRQSAIDRALAKMHGDADRGRDGEQERGAEGDATRDSGGERHA